MSSSSPTHLAARPHCLAIPPAGRSAGRRGQTPPGKRSETGTTLTGNTRKNGSSFCMNIKDDLIYNCIVLTITITVLVLTITISITTLPHHHHNHTTITTQTAKKAPPPSYLHDWQFLVPCVAEDCMLRLLHLCTKL